MQQNNGIKSLISDVLDFGDLLLIANKGIGKTNSLMVLAEQFKDLENTRIIIFEDFPKFCLEFSEMPYMIIRDTDVRETSHTVNALDYFLVHERDYAVLRGSEIQEALENNRHLIFVSEIADIERQAFFIYSIVQYFYRKAYLRKYKQYEKTERIVFIIEESQNVFDSSTISKKIFNRLGKIFSVARNLDMHFVLCSQRLQDLNTKIRGRTRLLIGQVSIDDYELKINRLLKHSKHREEILTLAKGSFLYTATDTIISFPKFEANGKPYEYKKPEKPKPKGLIQTLKDIFLLPKKPAPKPEPQRHEEPEQTERTEEEETEYPEEPEYPDSTDADLLEFGL